MNLMPIQFTESVSEVAAMNVPISVWSNFGPIQIDEKLSESLRFSAHDNGHEPNSEEEWRTLGKMSDASFDKSESEYLRIKKERMGV
jgi:hypothetical protein